MARTPPADRPVGRTSFSWKEIDLPWRVMMTISLSPVVRAMLMRLSPSFSFTAMMPVLREVSNWDISVFLITPFFVTQTRYSFSEYSLMGIMAVTFSPLARFRKFTMGVPLLIRCPSVISYALIR